jgi:hypothetical protein
VGPDEVGNDPPPLARELSRPVQEHDGCSRAALQDGGSHARELQAALGEGKASQQSVTGTSTRGWSPAGIDVKVSFHGSLSSATVIAALSRRK